MNEMLDFDVPEELLPSDTYDCFVQDARVEEGTKAPYFALTFTVAAGEYKGFQLFDNLSMSPKARRRLKRNLEAILGRNLGQERPEALVQEMRGRPCRVVVGQREYEGELQPDVTRILPSGSSGLFEVPEPGATPGAGRKGTAKSSDIDDLFGPQTPEGGEEEGPGEEEIPL